MQLEERRIANVAIIAVAGDVTGARGADVLLKDKVQSLIHQGYPNLIIDLSDVSHINSEGLGQLVEAYGAAKNRGGALKLLHVTNRIRDLLVVTRLLTVFDAFESEAEALASFGAPITA
jgi:anti-sigma B factor antagonist